MHSRSHVPLLIGLTCLLGGCDAALRDPQLGLTADSTTLTVRKGCTAHSASFCNAYNTRATNLHLERNGYAGAVTLSSENADVSLNPSVLNDTQTVTRLVFSDYTSVDKFDKTLSFSVSASAPGARSAMVTLAASLVWDPSFNIGVGKQIGTVVNEIGIVVQGQQASGTMTITRFKFPDPVGFYVATYVTSGPPSYTPSSPNLPGVARLSENPSTGSMVDLLFDAKSLPTGTYRVEVARSEFLDQFPLFYLVTVLPVP